MIFAREVGLPSRLRHASVGTQHAAQKPPTRKQSKA
jgi:hypothetical protein